MRRLIVSVAREYIGTPFHHAGRQKGLAVDCAGLVICVSRDLNLVPKDFDIPEYTPTPDGVTMLKWCSQHMRKIDFADLNIGDVLVLRTDVFPQHLGMVGDYRHGGFSIIHAAQNSGRVIETRLMFTRRLSFVAAYALPGIQ